jgi:ubiquinone/menaquinone biosynthesis C-methylase UbiE
MKMAVSEVVGQDVSSNALTICKRRHPDLKYCLFCGSLEDLKYHDNYFDLIVSTRVLSAVLPDDIEMATAKLCRLADNIYLNEMTDSDYHGASDYWFKHEYDVLMERNNFVLAHKGNIGKQTWKLYTKKNA